jgi:hypothetical protein
MTTSQTSEEQKINIKFKSPPFKRQPTMSKEFER